MVVVCVGALSALTAAWTTLVLLTVPVIALAITVRVRGLRRTWWWTWGIGTGWIVLFAGFVTPQLVPKVDDWGWLVALLSFVYAQLYFGILSVLDQLWIARHGGLESIEDARFRLRRMLQVRLLLATAVAGASIMIGSESDQYSPEGRYDPLLPLAPLLGCCCMPILFAVWFRWRPLAWTVAGLLAVFFAANLLPVDGDNRQRTILQYGWVTLVAVYLWTKAARVWYWPMKWPQPLPGPPGYVIAAQRPGGGG